MSDNTPVLPAMPAMGPAPQDYVDGPSSPALHNLRLDYAYTIGNRYRLTFDDSFGVTFQMMSDGSEPRGPIAYRCRELRADQYLVHWFVREHGIHVSLVIDLSGHKISVAALMPPGSWEFFDQAVDMRVTRNVGPGATVAEQVSQAIGEQVSPGFR